MSMAHAGRMALLWALVLLLVAPPGLLAQGPPPAPPPPGGAPAPPTFTPEELEQLVAPIALYPDALLAQVLMASTYPLEVVQAARWEKANPTVTGDKLEAAMQQQPWDPSVKSLTAVPQALQMLNDKLDWTQKLGDAFLAQEKDVMEAVQRLRGKAYATGNLKTTPEQTVVVEPAPAPQTVVVQQAPPQIIQIQSPNPQVIYVPTYNPTVVYGPWPYPAYPPYYYYPPGYVAGASLISFGVGVAVGAAIWGNCNWHGGSVNVNVNQFNSYNRTNISNTNWQHNTANRKGVPYRDQATARQYGQGTRPGADSREAYRGRTEAGRQQPGQGGGTRGQAGGASTRPAGQGLGGSQAGVGTREAGSRGGGLGGQPGGAGGTRGAAAYQGIGQGGQTRDFSNRGQASRQSMGQSRPTTTSAPRGGGGAAAGRGGGGGGGGRRR